MKIKIWITFLLCWFMSSLSAQKIFWSDLTREDVHRAVETSRIFFRNVESGNLDSLRVYIAEDSIYVGGQSWFARDLFLDMVIERAEEISFRDLKITGYRFDDFLEQFDQNEILDNVYPVFDNHSVLIQMKYQFDLNIDQVILVMRKAGTGWSITGFHGFGLYPETPSDQGISKREFRLEKIEGAGITLPVPTDFSDADRSENQINFYLRGETERDAVFQVLIDDLKAKVYYYTYKFVEYSNQQNELSDLVVRYLPYGILFEYDVMDSFGSKNKGITVGLKSGNKMVIIQFYAFYDIFKNREKEFRQVFDHVER
jgi:hypothetical protein